MQQEQQQQYAAASCKQCSYGQEQKCGREGARESCPVRMADGRLFTDYRPRCDANSEYMAPMSGNYEYRQYLIQNGTKILDKNRAAAAAAAACKPCANPSTMVPEVARFVCDKVSCGVVQVPGASSQYGIGTGRQTW